MGLLFACGLAAQTGPDPEEIARKVRERARDNLSKLPDHVCRQTVERMVRSTPAEPWKRRDTLRLEVGLSGNRELYSWQGASRFEEQELAELVGRGTVGTGSFALHAKTVLLTGAAEISYEGVEGNALRFKYSVPVESSRYRLRIHPNEAIVAFSGTFTVDPRTLNLMRLEVHAEDIPQKLGLARASDVIEYALVEIGDGEFLLPRSSELTLAGSYGDESVNRTTFGECRQYGAESRLSFAAETGAKPAAPPSAIPANTVLELELEREILLEQANLGDLVGARLAKSAAGAPAGTQVFGRIVRLETEPLPFPHYIIALRFDEVETPEGRAPLQATMERVEEASGLIRQSRRLNPTFTRDRRPRMDILVREHREGEGVLHWDARKPRIGRGLRMRWVSR
jgi:hypothetical protein